MKPFEPMPPIETGGHAIRISLHSPRQVGLCALISPEDEELVNQYRWHVLRTRSGDYAQANLPRGAGSQRRLLMHRLICGVPKGVEVDHIDGDGLNNQRSNLRQASHSQQGMNKRLTKNNTSGFKGVSWSKVCSKWRADIAIGGQALYLGIFADPVTAAKAYDAAARSLHGEYARLNFPLEGERGVA